MARPQDRPMPGFGEVAGESARESVDAEEAVVGPESDDSADTTPPDDAQ